MLHFYPIQLSYFIVQTIRQLLSCTVETFHSHRTPFYLQLCSPSFAPCLPYKYSSRIKRTPLASWPLTELGSSISYHSSCVACQAGRVPDETMRAYVFRRGVRGLPRVLPWSLLCPPPACLNNIPEV